MRGRYGETHLVGDLGTGVADGFVLIYNQKMQLRQAFEHVCPDRVCPDRVWPDRVWPQRIGGGRTGFCADEDSAGGIR